MAIKLLLVDDDPNILQALERRLRPLRQEWSLRFAEEGRQALALLTEEPADVVITDLRMPGMDGTRLLEELAYRHPGTLRIVLSGHGDDCTVLRMAAVAHQFVAKPCESSRLIAIVQRALRLRDRMANHNLQELVTGLPFLPILPHICSAINHVLSEKVVAADTLAGLVTQDIALTAKIMHAASLCWPSGRSGALTLTEAMRQIGVETLRALVLEQTVSALTSGHAVPRDSVDCFTRHSRMTGALAHDIAQMEGLSSEACSHAFMAGLLHDIGSLLLAGAYPERYAQAAARAGATVGICEAEYLEFGASHADVGAYLMGIWGLPDLVVEAISDHHTPAGDHPMGPDVLMAVHVAGALVHEVEVCRLVCEHAMGLDLAYLERIGLLAHVPLWRHMAGQMVLREG